MKVIKTDLPTNIETLEIHLFADEHIGDANSDIDRITQRIEYVRTHDNAYCILNGDILDYASRSSIGDIETREFNIMEQVGTAVELFEPIKDKIIAITTGNHENRAYKKEGIDLTKLIAMQMGLNDKYSPTSALVFVTFGQKKDDHGRAGAKRTYSIYMLHGSGGGRKEGAKAIRLADMSSIVDADVYVHSHTHLPMIMKQGYYRIDRINRTTANVTKLFVNTASNLNYGGYGEAQEYKPNSTDTPVIYLTASIRKLEAKL